MRGSVFVLVCALLGGCVSQAEPLAASGGPAAPTTFDSGEGPGVIEGTVTDPELRPIARARIDIASRLQTNVSISLSTDANGRFQATGLAPGEYLVYVGALGYHEHPPLVVTVVDDKPLELKFVLDPLIVHQPFHAIQQYGLLFREQVCVIANGSPSCVTGYVVANTTSAYETKEAERGELRTFVVQMQWAPTIGACAGAMRSDVFSPDQKTVPGPGYIETGARASGNPYHWDNVPDSIRSPTRLFVPRDGDESQAMWSPARTEANGGQPITVDGKWTITFFPQPVGQFGTPVDVSCVVEQRVTAYVAAFHVQPAAPDWDVFEA